MIRKSGKGYEVTSYIEPGDRSFQYQSEIFLGRTSLFRQQPDSDGSPDVQGKLEDGTGNPSVGKSQQPISPRGTRISTNRLHQVQEIRIEPPPGLGMGHAPPICKVLEETGMVKRTKTPGTAIQSPRPQCPLHLLVFLFSSRLQGPAPRTC